MKSHTCKIMRKRSMMPSVVIEASEDDIMTRSMSLVAGSHVGESEPVFASETL